MEDLVDRLARGNVSEVKVVLTTVALALAGYQLVLAAVGYHKLRPSFLERRPAFRAHRASGDTSAAELESLEERQEERLEQQEERREER
jgi:hypothetical protein